MLGLRAEAAQARAFGFALLAAEFGAKVAAARGRYTGDELMAALAALHSEQKAAESALRVKLTADARDRRRRVLATLAGQKVSRKSFRQAAEGVTARAKAKPPRRPRRRARDQGRSVRLKR